MDDEKRSPVSLLPINGFLKSLCWDSRQFVNFYLTLTTLTKKITSEDLYNFLEDLVSNHKHLARNILNEFIATGHYYIIVPLLTKECFSDYKPVIYSFGLDDMFVPYFLDLLQEKKVHFEKLTGDTISNETVIEYIPYFNHLLGLKQERLCLFLLINSRDIEVPARNEVFIEARKLINSFAEKNQETELVFDGNENTISNHFWMKFVDRRCSVSKIQKELKTFLSDCKSQSNDKVVRSTILGLLRMYFTIPLSIIVWFFQIYHEIMKNIREQIFSYIDEEIRYDEKLLLFRNLLEFLYEHFSRV
jgi:hypothetical protein